MSRLLRLLAVLAPLAPLGAQAPAASSVAAQRAAVRPLGPVVASTKGTSAALGTVAAVRQLPGGRLLVNDPATRRLLLLDSTLAVVRVVADSTSATGYTGRMAGLIPYRGDSTLFVDPQSLSMVVLDPAGQQARVMSVPRPQDAIFLAGSTALGTPGLDARGRLVYRTQPRLQMSFGTGGGTAAPQQPDTAPIVRVDLATRAVDTVAWVKVARNNTQVTRGEDGSIKIGIEVNPLPVVDEWSMLPDGRVAVVRGRDYHVDVYDADGRAQALPKVAFDWLRMTDEDKSAFIDSVKAARERLGPNAPPLMMGGGGPVMMQMTVGGPPPGGAAGGGQRRIVEGGDMQIVRAGPGAPNAGAAGGPPAPQISYVAPSELPDYRPAFLPGAVRADAEGRLWIRTVPTKQLPGGPVYDVIGPDGKLVERVQLPENRALVGFGADGSAYLALRDGTTTILERARVR